jgi:rhodanese-related sulfurtransferase
MPVIVARPTPRLRRAALAVLAVLALASPLAACGGTATSPAASPSTAAATAPLLTEVDVDTAAALVERGAFLLDVREPAEWAAGHVDGATLIPLGDLPARLAEVPRDRQVVVMCRTGHRSAQGRDILLQAGYPSVTSMTGGITEWLARGRQVVTGG